MPCSYMSEEWPDGEPVPEEPPCPRCGAPGEWAADAAERLAAPEETGEPVAETADEESAREELATYLAAPEEPRAFSIVMWLILLLIPVVNVLSLFVAPLKLGLRLFMGVVGLVWIGAIVWYAAGTFEDPFAAEDAVMMTGFTTILLYFIALFHSWRAARKDARTRLAPAWRASVERWDHLRYCDACRAVYYDDRPDESAAVEETAAFLGAPGEPSASVAPTPLWLWAVLAAVTVGGGRLALSAAGRVNGAADETIPAASPELLEDIQPDPLLRDSGRADSVGLDEPLLAPDTAARE